jgi:uncharacterized membrane protein
MRFGERLSVLPARVWVILGTALGLRLLLLPFIHPWDGNTFHNLFAQLAAGENPYHTFWELTLQARTRTGEGYARWYEYYAYPPLLMYLYWPLAKLAAFFGPLAAWFHPAGTLRVVPNEFPLAFLLLYKLPIWAADFAVAWMLWRRTGRAWVVGLWLLNPLVLLVSGTWMFDSIPAALTLGAFLAFEKDRVALAGALLALGFAAKYYPLFLLPTFFLALVWRQDARAFLLVGVFALVSLLLVAPHADGVGHVLAFNAEREGGGLSVHQLAHAWLTLTHGPLLLFKTLVSPALGALVLVAGMGATYILLDKRRPPLLQATTLTLLAFLLASKVVNEQYVLWLLPFLLLMLHERADPAKAGARAAAFHALWAVPFAYALVHVPVTALVPGGSPWTAKLLAYPTFLVVAAGVAALAFVSALLFALWACWPPPRAREVPA